MKLSFSLANSKTKPVGAAPSLKAPSAFAAADDDATDAAPTTSDTKDAASNKKLLAQNINTSRTLKKRLEAEQRVDATVFEYDEVYDRMQDAKAKQKAVKEQEAKEKKPKYIHGLLASAATRKLDHLRAEEKMIQRERETEGDEFADKEAFVTQAYKDQMAEVRQAEEEEKKREEAERKKRGGPPTGLARFYEQLLNETESHHEQTVAATMKPDDPSPSGPQLNLTITKPPEPGAKSDLELAQIARTEGKDVELNDDNLIVDKRELLSAGLNLSAPNTRRLGARSTENAKEGPEKVQIHTAVGTAASRREINERRAREIRRQMEEERERVTEEREREERERMERIVTKRNTEGDVQSARERYLARKRRKMEENDSSMDAS